MLRFLLRKITIVVVFLGLFSCGNRAEQQKKAVNADVAADSLEMPDPADNLPVVNALMVSPKNPQPGQSFRVMATGSKQIGKAKLVVNSPSGSIESGKSRTGEGLPYWRVDEFTAGAAGDYQVSLEDGDSKPISLKFTVIEKSLHSVANGVWNTERGWDKYSENLYSAWINAMFQDVDERSSWTALHEVTQNKDRNFLYNHLSLAEDDANGKVRVQMEPDCADNPYYLRAYFAWKLGLPFGYHESDRGGLGRAPQTGRWITNATAISKSNPTQKFNSFMRMVMNGVHSGTARAALKNENSDYYPVPLTREALRPGVIYADPYGHTLILVRQVSQTKKSPGVLLSVDAQPDGTVGIKRFWKGNFLFNTNPSEVIGEPGFKAFRPIVEENGKLRLLKTSEISADAGWIPFSIQQNGLASNVFYHTMERIINPKPLDPEMAVLDLIGALHEQLVVRITSVSNGEDYMKSHSGAVIPMPGGTSGVFQAGGLWEDFSTPNRDLRLLIAMDAVLDFPDKIVRNPEDFKFSMLQSPESAKKNIEALMDQKLTELSITYTRSNGTAQKLTMAEILKRRDAFEIAYNPNDGVEIRWGAPENSEERSTCRRHVSADQMKKMNAVRVWFQKRLHPPT